MKGRRLIGNEENDKKVWQTNNSVLYHNRYWHNRLYTKSSSVYIYCNIDTDILGGTIILIGLVIFFIGLIRRKKPGRVKLALLVILVSVLSIPILGNIDSDQGRYDEAISEYTGAIELDPHLISAYLARGNAYYFKDECLSAASDYSKVIELDPESIPAYYHRGWAQLVNEAYDGAIADFSKTVALDPSLVRVYNGRGWAYINKAQWKFESYNYMFILFESNVDLALAFEGKSWYYVRELQWDLAVIPALTKAITQDPDPAEAYCNVGFAHAKKGTVGTCY